jgi:putative oxidoreductase
MMEVLLNPMSGLQDIGLLIVRLVMGIVFIYYGWPKIKNLKSNAADFVSMGFKPGWFWGTVVAALEFFGGLAILLGVLAHVFGGLMVLHMLTGTIWKMTKTDKPFTDYSYDLLLGALGLVLLVFGAGVYSLV